MKKSSPTIPFPILDKLFEQEATQKGILDSNGVFLALTITKAFGEARVKVLFYGLKFYAIRLLCSFFFNGGIYSRIFRRFDDNFRLPRLLFEFLQSFHSDDKNCSSLQVPGLYSLLNIKAKF